MKLLTHQITSLPEEDLLIAELLADDEIVGHVRRTPEGTEVAIYRHEAYLRGDLEVTLDSMIEHLTRIRDDFATGRF